MGDLTVLQSIVDLLNDNGMPYWVAGGLAVDGFFHKKTRSHKDIDFLILQKDKTRLSRLLVENSIEILESDAHKIVTRLQGIIVEFLFIEETASTYTIQTAFAQVSFPKRLFDKEGILTKIKDVKFKIVPLEFIYLSLQRSKKDQQHLEHFEELVSKEKLKLIKIVE